MRVDEDQPWVRMCLGQPLWNFVNACFFEYAIAVYDLQLGEQLRMRGNKEQFRRDGRSVLRKIWPQMRQDHLVHPLLSGPPSSTPWLQTPQDLARDLWAGWRHCYAYAKS
jgi:linoleoyl-CoA desaturase